jgi:hypothetical protein
MIPLHRNLRRVDSPERLWKNSSWEAVEQVTRVLESGGSPDLSLEFAQTPKQSVEFSFTHDGRLFRCSLTTTQDVAICSQRPVSQNGV